MPNIKMSANVIYIIFNANSIAFLLLGYFVSSTKGGYLYNKILGLDARILSFVCNLRVRMSITRPVTLLFLLLLYSHLSLAQQNNIWMFGENVGLDFNGGSPRVFKADNIDARAGTAVVCDGVGKLLFYASGQRVYNRDGKLMPGSDKENPETSMAQCPLVIPWVGRDKQYFVFYRNDKTKELRYSVVDMTLDESKGDIMSAKKNIFLDNNISVKMLAIRGGDGCKVWLLTHKSGSNEFRSYKITESGIDSRYISSSVGAFNSLYSYTTGNMDISRNYTLAVGSGEDEAIELFTFEPESGRVKDARVLDTFSSVGRVHSVCFSWDGSRLYVTGGPGGSDLLQYNMWAPLDTPVRLNDSSVYLNGMLRLGPDRKIYSANWEGVYCISKPDSLGVGAGFSNTCISLPAGIKSVPWFMGSEIISPSLNYAGSTTTYDICNPDTMTLAVATKFGIMWNNNNHQATRISGQQEEEDIVRIQTTLKNCVFTTDTLIFHGCDCMQIPTAFTPNGDGKNDFFRIKGDDIVSLDIMIYNRWGQRMFLSKDKTMGWDGTFNGEPCEIGTYYFYAIAHCKSGTILRRSGDIVLIR